MNPFVTFSCVWVVLAGARWRRRCCVCNSQVPLLRCDWQPVVLRQRATQLRPAPVQCTARLCSRCLATGACSACKASVPGRPTSTVYQNSQGVCTEVSPAGRQQASE